MTLWVTSGLLAELEQDRANYEMRVLHVAALVDDKIRTKRERRQRSGAIRRAWTLKRERENAALASFWRRVTIDSPAWAKIGAHRFTRTL